MSKWYPPLTCPIPRGHASHYENTFNGKLAAILRVGSYSRAKLYRTLLPAKDAFPGYLFDDRLEQPSTYYRLFKRRSADKSINHKKSAPEYIMFDPNGKFIRIDHTLKDSKHQLAQDETLYRNRHKQLTKREIPVGSYVLKVFDEFENFNWEVPTIQDNAPVAVKRCEECPNKTSTQGRCSCGFWSAIRDGTHTKVWWSIHDRRMHDIRKSKEEKKLLKIKVSLQSLFED